MVRRETAAPTVSPGEVTKKKRSVVAALFLDKETATYSLSKFQFYLWTAVSVFGYVYLEASTCIVQGVWKFIDIPSNLPSIVFISASTGALAQFVTAQRGPKGAGEEHPSLADFVSSGGVISAERVQFFIWTILGVAVFLWLVILQDPASISSLPTVPDGFLQLMGISSLGYLSGKFARRPGPVINDIAPKVDAPNPDPTKPAPAAPTNGKVTLLTVRGRILSPDADFKITYQAPGKAGSAAPEEKEILLTGELAPKKIDVLERDEQSNPDKTAKKLELTINQGDLKWLRGASKFTISNPDGQCASWPFPPAPAIESIQASKADTSLRLTLQGKNLSQTATFQIDGKEITKTQLPPAGIKAEADKTSPAALKANKLELTITNPDASWTTTGSHSLEIVNPDGLSAEGSYTLEAKPPTPTGPSPATPPPPTNT
jgi:hypothetical protein